MKLKEAAALYIAEKRERRRESTVEGYASALRCHVLPRWGETDIESIDPADIQEWIDSFAKPGAALKAWKTLRQVVRWAIRRLDAERVAQDPLGIVDCQPADGHDLLVLRVRADPVVVHVEVFRHRVVR